MYDSITVNDGATLTLDEGVYVVTEFSPSVPGFRVMNGGRVESTGGVTIYLACEDYPTPCDGDAGSRFRLDDGGEFVASPPATGEYAGLSIFADPGNTRSMQLRGPVNLTGAVYAASAPLVVFPFLLAPSRSTPCWSWTASPPSTSTRCRSTTTRACPSSGSGCRSSSAEIAPPPVRERFVRTGWFAELSELAPRR